MTHPGDQQPPSFEPRRKRQTSDRDNPPAYTPKRRSILQSDGAGETNRSGGQPPAYTPKRRSSFSRPGSNTEQRPAAPVVRAAVKPAAAGGETGRPTRKKRRRPAFKAILAIVVVALIAWPVGLLLWANSQITHIDALTTADGTSGTTWLIAGSDRRSDGSDGGIRGDESGGARTDSIILIHQRLGQASVISIPRDSAVDIPGYGVNKINSAYSYGGATLLVATVEKLSSLTIDHYIEISMGGVTQMVDAAGGVELCYDSDVNDPESQMVWTAGCHMVDGPEALAFSRMRKADPRGDIGRAERQRQVVKSLVNRVTEPKTMLNPNIQVQMSRTISGTLITDHSTGMLSIARAGLAYKSASRNGLTGTPPIADTNWSDGIHGSMVLLDEERGVTFWNRVADGGLTRADFEQRQP
ncbi:MAG: LCP family protein [Varibaculum sp.]|nr:LCP family protein [Varibaculum sp.]